MTASGTSTTARSDQDGPPITAFRRRDPTAAEALVAATEARRELTIPINDQ